MTPAARVQAAIDLLDAVIAAAGRGGASADRIAAEWFRTRRFIGSKDRRAIRDRVWDAIRACGDVPPSGRAAMLRVAQDDPALTALFDGSRYGPASIVAGEPLARAGVAPGWLADALMQSGIDAVAQGALLDRAPLDLRANTLKITRDELSARLPVPAEPGPAPDCLRLPHGAPAESWPEFAQGLFEVQDGGSQVACGAIVAQPGETVVDLCAGAGGKTLALAAAMAGHGRLIACDIDRARLSRLPERAQRAGALVETRLLDAGREAAALTDLVGSVDAVLVDAPCSGTGTWRRNPEARWRLTAARLDRLVAEQARILDFAAPLLAPGGALVYATCALTDREGKAQVDSFLRRHAGWTPEAIDFPLGRAHGAGWLLTPGHDGTDGFFFARLRRTAA